ncbi:MAG: class A beta-lactamase-related serine hydrolase [Ignavibacteriales bacterium]|nr:MAG: class A beta-lactamase-related serine hydrolase [Ignavibacteriales bacterium]
MVVAISFLLAYTTSLSQNDPQLKSLDEDLNSYFKEVIETQKYVALGACIIKNDEVIWKGSYGYSDLENKKLLKADDIIQIASLSKTVTAAALMTLYDKGLFKLDDDINDYIPIKVRNPNFPEKPITFRMLLTHTSSLEDVLSNGLKVPKGVERPHGVSGDPDISLNDFIKELFVPGGKYYSIEYFSTEEPGTKYSYSNFSFALIGYLVEHISKKDFSEYCKENIFIPLGMKDTGWMLRDVDTNRVIFGYGSLTNDNIIAYKKVKPFGVPDYPSGNLRTTLDDFAKFLSAFMNKGIYNNYQLLKPETVELMLAPQGIKNIPSRSFPILDIGLTWLLNDIEGTTLYNMNGFSGSGFTNAYFSPKEKIGILYFFTGLTMKNMMGMLDITLKLYHSVK